MDDTPPLLSPLRAPPPPHPLGDGGLPGEPAPCVDEAGSFFCAQHVARGKCHADLSVSLQRCRSSCKLCGPQDAAGEAHAALPAQGGEGEAEDISGYGHHATPFEAEQARAEARGDWRLRMIILIGLVGFVVVCAASLLPRLQPACTKPDKLEAKCAV